jgi:hypothetical protein
MTLSRFCVVSLVAVCVSLPGFTAAQETGGITAPNSASPAGFFPEPGFIARGIDVATRTMGDGGDAKNGFFPEMSNMPTGAGWITLGPGYRRWLLNDAAIAEGSAAVSWRSYKMAQGRFEFPTLARSRVAIGTQARWQDLTQVTYFGEGPNTLENTRSEYRVKSVNVVGYTVVRPTQWLAVGGRLGWIAEPTILPPGGKFLRGNPDARDVFPHDAVYQVGSQPSFAHRELSIAVDTRDHRSHPLSGGLYRGAWSAYRDQDHNLFNFNRLEVEAAHFIPLAESRVVVALHGWTVASDPLDGNTIPFYLLPSLGGANTLRAYTDYRFHDRNMVVANVEARVSLFTHVDAAVFVDAGNVAERFADLNLDKHAYGIGFRLHSHKSTFARVDFATGEDGRRFFFRLSDPLHLSRLSRRLAAIPFVP